MTRTWRPMVSVTLVVVDGPEGTRYERDLPPMSPWVMSIRFDGRGTAAQLAGEAKRKPTRVVTYHRRPDIDA